MIRLQGCTQQHFPPRSRWDPFYVTHWYGNQCWHCSDNSGMNQSYPTLNLCGHRHCNHEFIHNSTSDARTRGLLLPVLRSSCRRLTFGWRGGTDAASAPSLPACCPVGDRRRLHGGCVTYRSCPSLFSGFAWLLCDSYPATSSVHRPQLIFVA